ncbi:MAG: efflux RND transporter periplasmic adaptor subunit [Peptococcaceae bacterium]|jgi:RND family efflux transporter MFP subunit|nr:efflux RND transporter periplasmic adaptor subunit [Peptococcaceae bacterium]
MNRRTPKIVLSGLLIGAALWGLNGCGATDTTTAETSVNIETAAAEIKTIDKYVTYTGRVKGSNEVSVLPKIASRVTAVYVQAGQSVGAGQTIASLDSSDLEVSMAQARASLAAAQASKAANDIKIEAAERNYARLQSLFEAGAIASRDLEAARDELNALTSGTVSANLAQIEASLRSLEQQLQNCQITTPIAGVVGWLDLSIGQTVNPQAPVALINPDNGLEIELMITESDISYLTVGQQVNVSIDAVDSAVIAASVKTVSSIANQASRSYPVVIALPNPEGKIKSGMFAEVRLATLHKPGVVCIPLTAVLPQEGVSVVFTVNAEQRAEKLSVKTGVNDGVDIEITEGLQAGQPVITKGNTLVQDGTLTNLADGGSGQ